ncbi:glycosyltransferase family 1 protein [Nitratifractor sp.]|uniref:glycosyltransferase family 4 protein n=1 Tax=Nitratifractor sp. TaxID=2268144 RepID=UPI0025D7CDB6|nr:glycosyltransferase family 1 protein [Nitratifractor sp.]
MPSRSGPARLLIITDTICDTNGVSRFLRDLAATALERGTQLHILSASRLCRGALPGNIRILTPTLRTPMPWYPEQDLVLLPPFRALAKEIEAIAPDVVHLSTPGPIGLAGRRIARRMGLPLFGTYHTDFPAYLYANTGRPCIQRLAEGALRRFYRDFQGIFIRSEAYRPRLIESMGFPHDRIHPLPPGIDLNRFAPRFRDSGIWRRYGLEKEGFKALYVGRTTREKNLPFLLESWKILHRLAPELTLVIIGTGEFYKHAESYRKYGIRFLGEIKGEALSRLYASSDLFLFPSLTDTLGQVVMEAMASGLPVIVADKGGPATLLDRENPGGWILPADDPRRYAQWILNIARNPALRKQYADNALQSARDFDFSHTFDAFWGTHFPTPDSQIPKGGPQP